MMGALTLGACSDVPVESDSLVQEPILLQEPVEANEDSPLESEQESMLLDPSEEEPGPEVDPGPTDGLFHSGDPFADPGAEVVSRDGSRITQEHLWEGETPQSQMVELEAAPEVAFDDALLEQAAELGLARLRATYLTDVLSGDAIVHVPGGIRTFGEVLPIRFEVHNPLGDPVELLGTEVGYLLELNWTVERWLPIGGHDLGQQHRYFRLNQLFRLGPDETFIEYTGLPLEVDGDQGAAWIVDIDAKLICNGALFEERTLPVHGIDFQGVRFLVLPPGWEQFQDDPLKHLERVLAMPSSQVDRHVLVTVALLRGDDRQYGVELLLEGLHAAPHAQRALTITQALQWLTGVQLGSLPEDWFQWEAQRKLSATR
jgi:hypothetical protein